MMMSKILRYIFALLLANSMMLSAVAASDSTRVRGIQYASREEAAAAQRAADNPLFAGASLSADAVGLIMMAASSHGQAEAALRLNLKNKYFPIFEMGWGVCDHDEFSTGLHYKTNAPYFRIGCDYNFCYC